MDASILAGYVAEVQSIGDAILTETASLVPGAAVPAGAAEVILNLVAQMVTKALTAYSAASGTPINISTVADLLPNQAPLTPPNAA